MDNMLTIRQRIQARRMARACWIRSNADAQQAELLFRSAPEMQAIDPALIILLLKIAIELWMYWQANKINEPSSVPSELEPGNWSEDDEG